MSAERVRPPIRPRVPPVCFSGAVPRYWKGDRALDTHLANSLNLFVPGAERFMIRTVRAHLERIEDPVLRQQARGLCGQEGWHAQAHEDFTAVLEAQGY